MTIPTGDDRKAAVERFQDRRLSRPVRSGERDRFSRDKLERHAVDDRRVSVGNVDGRSG